MQPSATATPTFPSASLSTLNPSTAPWPPHLPLAGSEAESFAHGTITRRLPAILSGVMKDMEGLAAAAVDAGYGAQLRAAAAEIRTIHDELLQAHASTPGDLTAPPGASAELQASVASTNQSLAAWRQRPPLSSSSPSLHVPCAPGSWLSLPWLLVECYMYVRIAVAVQRQPLLQAVRFDPFHVQKLAGFHKSLPSVASMAAAVLQLVERTTQGPGSTEEGTYAAVQYALWGNKTDLSLLVDASNIDPAALAAPAPGSGSGSGSGSPYLIVDEFLAVWRLLGSRQKPAAGGQKRRVDIVLDNSGLELYSDLCLADVLLEYDLADEVVLHGKPFPWFVSDTTREDLEETLQLCSSPSPPVPLPPSSWAPVPALATRWSQHLSSGRWRYSDHTFWVTPAPFCWMEALAPGLYGELRDSSTLVLLKGDLNYRKLTHDCRWPWTTEFKDVLQGFHPAPLLSLRTLKADVIAGLKPGQGEALGQLDPEWQVNGKFGVIQAAL